MRSVPARTAFPPATAYLARIAALLAAVAFLAGCETASTASPDAGTAVAPTPTGAGASSTPTPTPSMATSQPTGVEQTSPPAMATSAIMTEREGRRFGIAGLIPPNFPDSSDGDWLRFLGTVPELGGTIGNYAPMHDLSDNQEVGVAAGLEVLPVTGFHQETDLGMEVTVNFDDEAERAVFIDGLLEFARQYRPPYLGIGNEVNRVWEEDSGAFDAWVAALPEIVAAVHRAVPGTQVFATFQYEFLLGRDTITGVGRAEDWTPLQLAAPHLDLVGFTSFPYFDFEHPGEIPDDYYEAIRQHTDRPVGFTEIGWPSEPIAPLAGTGLEGLGGSPEEQAAFIGRLGELLDPVSPRFAMWVWAYDTPAVGPTFESLGLSSSVGEPKPALEAWRAFVDSGR